MARAAADVNRATGKSPLTKKGDSEAASVDEWIRYRGSRLSRTIASRWRNFLHQCARWSLQSHGELNQAEGVREAPPRACLQKAVSCPLGEQLALVRTPRKAALWRVHIIIGAALDSL